MDGNKIVKYEIKDLTFKTKGDAFDYFFISALNSGIDDVEAAERAEKLASIVAKAKKIPDETKTKVEEGIETLEKLIKYGDSHPKIAEFLSGIVLGVISTKAVDSNDTKPDFDESKSEIDLDSIED